MARQPSADPYKLILGKGVLSARENHLEDIEPRDKQVWIVKNNEDNVIDIEQYDVEDDKWESILDQFPRTVSGMSPDETGGIEQLVKVDGPSPTEDGRERQVGIDPSRDELFFYWNGQWELISSLDSVEGATQTHSLDPNADQVDDPTSAPSAAIGGGTGNLSAGDYKWQVTFICDWGETLPGSSTTSVLTVSSGDDVDLSNLPTASESIVTGRKIYRTKAGGDTFFYVDTITDNSTTNYTDTVADSALGSEPPSTNTTEAHNGSLPEGSVAFDPSAGHNHDGANSREVVIPEHDIAGSKHTGGLPWSDLENVPSLFPAESHDIAGGKHTGKLPWSDLENVPSLASDPHGDTAHSEDYAKDQHDNTAHSANYIVSAEERIRYSAGQLGDINAMANLQPPVPIDVSGEIVKAYAVARVAPGSDVSSTITIEDSGGSSYFNHVITLTSGDKIVSDTGISGTSISDESILYFSLDDSDATGQDFAVYLIIKTEIGS